MRELRGIDLNLLVLLDALLQTSSVSRGAEEVGLSVPAMSHALGRLRVQFGDPLLVRAGRGMVLSARGQQLRPEVRRVLEQIKSVVVAPGEVEVKDLQREFHIRATDHLLLLLGERVDAAVTREAPGVSLHFSPNTGEDSLDLREGRIDLALGVYYTVAPEIRIQGLFEDRFVCVVREGHPEIEESLSLEQYVSWPHIQVAPRGRPGGYIDDQLAERGLQRRVSRRVPFFSVALRWVAQSDAILTISERLATSFAPRYGLQLLPPPLALKGYPLHQIWHPRSDQDPAHKWLRQQIFQVARGLEALAPPPSRGDVSP